MSENDARDAQTPEEMTKKIIGPLMDDLPNWNGKEQRCYECNPDWPDEPARLRARVAVLEADKARLVAALEPFAALVGELLPKETGNQGFRIEDEKEYPQFTAKHIRDARAELDAMGGGDDG